MRFFIFFPNKNVIFSFVFPKKSVILSKKISKTRTLKGCGAV